MSDPSIKACEAIKKAFGPYDKYFVVTATDIEKYAGGATMFIDIETVIGCIPDREQEQWGTALICEYSEEHDEVLLVDDEGDGSTITSELLWRVLFMHSLQEG
jgi:hypothetical protein